MSDSVDASIKRRQSSIPDPEFIEAFNAYRKREKRRRSTFMKSDQTVVDIAKTEKNIALIVGLIGGMIVLIVLACAYYRMT